MGLNGFQIATIRGIPIRVHVTFLLVLPFIAYGFARDFRAAAHLANVPPDAISGSPWLWGLGVGLALFASVLVHELAHSLYAIKKGGKVRGITLLMVGGVSQMSEMPRAARHEAVMALVGPVASVAIGAGFYLLHWLAADASFSLRFAMFYLGGVNVFLGIFNLLPAFPMDGGRILRAVLTSRVGPVRATNIAARVGAVFALLFAVWGFVTFNMLLLLIAFFVFIGAQGEAQAVMANALLGRLRVRDLMTGQVFSVPADLSVHEAAERMLRERRLAFAATVDGHSVGLITLDAIQAVPPDLRSETPARKIAVETPSLSPSEDVGKALRIMGETALPQLAVEENGRLVGTIRREEIMRELKLSELAATQHQNGPIAAAIVPPRGGSEHSSSWP